MNHVFYIFFIIFCMSGAAFAQDAAIEMGQGEYQPDMVCQGTTGETIQKAFYSADILRTKAYCKDGQFNGVVKKYNENGKIRFKAEYVAGKLQGTAKLHDANGNLLFRDEYENGLQKGRYRYNEKGELVQVK